MSKFYFTGTSSWRWHCGYFVALAVINVLLIYYDEYARCLKC